MKRLEIFIVIILSIGVFSCDKEDDSPTLQDSSTNTLPPMSIGSQGEFLDRYMPESEFFTIYSDTVITTSAGSSLTIDYSKFYDASGSTPQVFLDHIEIEVKELLKKKELIFSGNHSRPFLAIPVEYDRLIYIDAKHEDVRLLVDQEFVKIKFSSNFYALHKYVYVSHNDVTLWNWPTNHGVALLPSDTLYTHETYLPNTGWTGIFHWRTDLPGQNVNMGIDSINDIPLESVYGYAVTDSFNTVVPILFDKNMKGEVQLLSEGQHVKILCYGFLDRELYTCIFDTVVVPRNQNLKLKFSKASEQELVNIIDNL